MSSLDDWAPHVGAMHAEIAHRSSRPLPVVEVAVAMLRGAATADHFAVVPPNTSLTAGDAVRLVVLP